MRRTVQVVSTSMLVVSLAGCAATRTGAVAPPNNPLAKVALGMSKPQVRQILGAPTAESGHITGKAFIPIYFGGDDAHRTTYYYKGVGRVVFADGTLFGGGTPAVIDIDYDPGETGVER